MKFLHQLWANDQHLTGVLCNTVFKRIFSPLIDSYLENSINKGIPYTNLVDLVNGKRNIKIQRRSKFHPFVLL